MDKEMKSLVSRIEARVYEIVKQESSQIVRQALLRVFEEGVAEPEEPVRSRNRRPSHKGRQVQANFVEFLRSNGESKIGDLASKFGLSRKNAHRYLCSLRETGVVVMDGYKGSATYRLATH